MITYPNATEQDLNKLTEPVEQQENQRAIKTKIQF